MVKHRYGLSLCRVLFMGRVPLASETPHLGELHAGELHAGELHAGELHAGVQIAVFIDHGCGAVEGTQP